MTPGPVPIVEEFLARINAHDVDGLCSMLTDSHCFTDSEDVRIYGREEMCAAWEQFFSIFPDYKVTVHHVLGQDDLVIVIGRAQGTFAPDGVLHDENVWNIPAAWRARVTDGRIDEWQVYADMSGVREIMADSDDFE